MRFWVMTALMTVVGEGEPGACVSTLWLVLQAPGGRIRDLGYLVLTRAGGRPCRNAGRIPVRGAAWNIN